MNGLFDLDKLFDESVDSDELMNLEVNMGEASEFATNNPATNPTQDIDKDATGAKDLTIPVPGGDKEAPAAKPADEHSIPIPGGLNETPTAKPSDAMSIPVPAGTTLSSDAYNDALNALQKSYKESIETLEMMKKMTVIDESTEDDVLLESFDSDDKAALKSLCKTFKKNIGEHAKDLKYEWKAYTGWTTFSSIILSMLTVWPAAYATLFKRLFSYHGFQIVGLMLIDNNNITDVMKQLNKKYKEDLDDYKLFADSIFIGLPLKRKLYLIYLDKKAKNILSENLKAAVKKTESDPKVKKAVEEANKKDSPKTESTEPIEENKKSEKCDENCDGKDCKDKDCKNKDKEVKEAYELDLDNIEL